MKSNKNSSVAFSSSSPKIGLDYVTITHWVNFISAMGNLFDSIITFGARYDKARYKLMSHSLIVLYCLFFCCKFFFQSFDQFLGYHVSHCMLFCFQMSRCCDHSGRTIFVSWHCCCYQQQNSVEQEQNTNTISGLSCCLTICQETAAATKVQTPNHGNWRD